MISFICNIYFTGKLKNHSFLVERITLFRCNTIFKVLQHRKRKITKQSAWTYFKTRYFYFLIIKLYFLVDASILEKKT